MTPSGLIASVQGSPGSPVDHPAALLPLAQASLQCGVRMLRLEGVASIRLIRQATEAPCIGLIKRVYEGSEVYITPTSAEVKELLPLGCPVIALDATQRSRPGGETLAELVALIQGEGRLAMADCDGPDAVRHALASGCDWIGTTLAGYTPSRSLTAGPDFQFLREAVALAGGRPVIAEGRFSEPWQVQAALAMGASAVVVGGALNDPVKQTKAFLAGARAFEGSVGAVDIGGTWLRFTVEDSDGTLGDVVQTPLLAGREERLDWIASQAKRAGVERIGISTGGTVDPASSTVIEAKPLIPDHLGTRFSWPSLEAVALNDGLATAWGHAFLPSCAGRRVATLALGTGVGFGLVDRGRIWRGSRGEYPRLNDCPAPGGATFEELLGGAALTPDPSREQRAAAQLALHAAVDLIRGLYMPDLILICGGVGLAPWLVLPEGVERSPFGTFAGLRGAAALARHPQLAAY